MPISKYYKGHGTEVMANMKKEYGGKKGEQVFYATANKKKQKPAEESAAHEAAESPAKEASEHGAKPAFPQYRAKSAATRGSVRPAQKPAVSNDQSGDTAQHIFTPTKRKSRGFKAFGEMQNNNNL